MLVVIDDASLPDFECCFIKRGRSLGAARRQSRHVLDHVAQTMLFGSSCPEEVGEPTTGFAVQPIESVPPIRIRLNRKPSPCKCENRNLVSDDLVLLFIISTMVPAAVPALDIAVKFLKDVVPVADLGYP